MTAAPEVAKLGLRRGMVVQELGWDSDVDADLRDDMMDVLEGDLVDESLSAVDAVLLWWRAEDGDLLDGLMDALTDLSESGFIWLLTPRVGREGYVNPTQLAEDVAAAGMALTTTANVSRTWQAQRVVRPKGGRR